MSAVVTMQDVGKRYVKYEDVPLLVTRALRFSAKHRRSHLWALRHIDLEVHSGECVGVIGRNGSGKTSMLRMLAGVTAPTEGIIRVKGRVAPLISVGIGFHRELTGRENVYVNGTILGLSKSQIDRLFDSIVAFAEIEEFIDTPVKFYSSGMFVRLGFSVAVAADPELLLVDEVLAVGDLNFQRRCQDRIEEIRRGGATVLVVSHNMHAVRTICSRSMLLNAGSAVFTGPVDEAISRYHDIIGQSSLTGKGKDTPTISVTDVEITNSDGKPSARFAVGDEMVFRVDARFSRSTEQPIFGVKIHTDGGQLVYSDNSPMYDRRSVAAGETVRCVMRARTFMPSGTYMVVATVVDRADRDTAVVATSPTSFFYVAGRPSVKGAADLDGRFGLTVIGNPSSQYEASDGSVGNEKGSTEAPLAGPSPGH